MAELRLTFRPRVTVPLNDIDAVYHTGTGRNLHGIIEMGRLYIRPETQVRQPERPASDVLSQPSDVLHQV